MTMLYGRHGMELTPRCLIGIWKEQRSKQWRHGTSLTYVHVVCVCVCLQLVNFLLTLKQNRLGSRSSYLRGKSWHNMAWLHCILSTQICCDLLELPLAHSYLHRLRPDKNKAGFGLTSSGILWGDDFGCFFWGAFLGRSLLLPDVMNTIFHYISHISIGKWHYLDSFSWRRKCFLLFSESGRYLCFTSKPRDLDDLGSCILSHGKPAGSHPP